MSAHAIVFCAHAHKHTHINKAVLIVSKEEASNFAFSMRVLLSCFSCGPTSVKLKFFINTCLSSHTETI